MEKLLSAQQVSDTLRISVWTTYRWARTGYLKSIRVGRRRLFDEDDLKEFIRRMKEATQATDHLSDS